MLRVPSPAEIVGWGTPAAICTLSNNVQQLVLSAWAGGKEITTHLLPRSTHPFTYQL